MRQWIGNVLWRRWLQARVRADTQPHRNELKAQGRALKAQGRELETQSKLFRVQVDRLGNDLKTFREERQIAEAKLTSLLDGQDKILKEAAQHRESLERTIWQLHLARRFDYEQRAELPNLPTHLDVGQLESHIRSAIDRATLETEPCPHLVVTELFPSGFYSLLIKALPPPGFWTSGRVGRENWTIGEDIGPTLAESVWGFMNNTLAEEVLTPALLAKYRDVLEEYWSGVFPDATAHILRPGRRSEGRLMLRRPGYQIEPHLDPSRALLTCLLYLARLGDSEEYGTKLYHVSEGLPDKHKGVFYADDHKVEYELGKLIPYRPNSALVFLSQRALHSADIPSDASPATQERFAYQFYVPTAKETRKKVGR